MIFSMNIYIYISDMYTSHTPLLAWAWGVVAPSEASMEAPQKVPKRHVADARCIQRWENLRIDGTVASPRNHST